MGSLTHFLASRKTPGLHLDQLDEDPDNPRKANPMTRLIGPTHCQVGVLCSIQRPTLSRVEVALAQARSKAGCCTSKRGAGSPGAGGDRVALNRLQWRTAVQGT